jgi:type IV secretion system protein VirB10
MPESVPLKPAPPLAKRLNRNALIVAGVLAGITALTAVVLVRPGREPERPGFSGPTASEELAAPSRPTFLDQPVRFPAASAHPGASLASGARPAPGLEEEVKLPWPAPDTAPPGSAPGQRSGPSGRIQAYRAALASPLLLLSPVPTLASSARADTAANTSLATEEQQLLSLGDSVLRAAARSGGNGNGGGGGGGTGVGGASSLASGADPRHGAFLHAAQEIHGERGPAAGARLEPLRSPYTLRAGTLIPGVLLTGINSDLPGDVLAQVSRDVYDSDKQQSLLIPKGARLLGTYDHQIAAGEVRLLVAWTRLILPDGRSLALPGLELVDRQGQTGATGEVDTHWRRVFGNALLLSALSAGAQLSQPRQASVLAPPATGQVAAGALGQELSGVASEMVRRGLDVPPTITIPQGQSFNVFLKGDLVFDGPYQPVPRGLP